MRVSASHDLRTLVASYHPVIVMETVEEERARRLLRETAAEMGLPFFEWTVTRGLRRPPNQSMIHGTNDPQVMLRHLESLTIEAVYMLKDLGGHLSNPQIARQFRELCQKFAQTRSALVLTGADVDLPSGVRHKAVYYSLQLPSREELKEVMETALSSLRRKRTFDVDLRPGDLGRFISALRGMTLNQARQAVAYAVLEDGRLDAQDVRRVQERKAQMIRDGGILEFFPAEDNQAELGGFANLQDWLKRAQIGFSPRAQELNLRAPKGILIVGVQGCGKSLAAKVIARRWQMPLLKLDAGSLYDKYVGESEKNFRRAVSMAESMAPAVMWIDEIEKAFGPAGSSDQDGGLSRRLLGAFLTWLQEKSAEVFVVATANDLGVLPPEMMRKGRFDEIFFVDLPVPQDRRRIFEIHLGLRNQEPARFDLDELARASEGFSGAEIEQAVIAAAYRSLHQGSPLSTALILGEISDTVPLSVSRREDIERLRSTARNRFVNAA
ncbi:MAG TPA: AAA family ATPase [Acidobacteriota bacterium]|nr:AAA family ATPase [Acidobacteriota bacterium]